MLHVIIENKSIEVLFLPQIQDPPIVLCASAKSGESLNTDLYKAYTSSGRYIEFVVWPAVLLHESGPVLAKGVAQGTNEKKIPNAWVDDKATSEYYTTQNRYTDDYGSLARSKREESYHADSYSRDNRYLSYGEDRHHQRSKSAEATRPSYKQCTVATIGLGIKTIVPNQRQKYEKHPTPEEMRRYFYYIDRRDYTGAHNALGYDIYMKCMFNEHKRSKYC